MIVENYKEKFVKKNNQTCLFKRFGSGVHLIKYNYGVGFLLMVIFNGRTDVLFIDEDNLISCVVYVNKGEVIYYDFDEYYTYIKKLDYKELIVNLEGDLNDEKLSN